MKVVEIIMTTGQTARIPEVLTIFEEGSFFKVNTENGILMYPLGNLFEVCYFEDYE